MSHRPNQCCITHGNWGMCGGRDDQRLDLALVSTVMSRIHQMPSNAGKCSPIRNQFRRCSPHLFRHPWASTSSTMDRRHRRTRYRSFYWWRRQDPRCLELRSMCALSLLCQRRQVPRPCDGKHPPLEHHACDLDLYAQPINARGTRHSSTVGRIRQDLHAHCG